LGIENIVNTSLRLILLACLLISACAEDAGLAVGTLERDRIELPACVSEVIVAIYVTEGDTVTSGQVIMQLDTRISQAELAALAATKEQSAARVAELERGPRFERIAEGRALVAGSQSLLVEAQHNLTRIQSLFKRGLASQADLDRAEANYKSADANLSAEQESLRALENGTTTEELQQARQALAVAQANVVRSQLLNDKLSIKSPRDGLVDDIVFKLGEQPRAGDVVAVILGSGATYARVYIPLTHRVKITSGTQLMVDIEGVDAPIKGTVRKISSDPAFTPYYALTERDRSRLAYLAEIDLPGEFTATLPVGLPVQVDLGR
jgi:HlyD family secretion protein